MIETFNSKVDFVDYNSLNNVARNNLAKIKVVKSKNYI